MRKATRFKPDPLDSALVQFSVKSKFTPECCALIINESYTGSALILITDHKLKVSQDLNVKVGKLAPLKAKVVWLKELEPSLIKIGIHFADPVEE